MVVALSESEQAVVAWLAASGGWPDADHPSVCAPGGWVAEAGPGGGGPDGDPDSVHFHKTRRLGTADLHVVSFVTRRGKPQTWLVRTLESADGVHVADPIGGGTGPDPQRDFPWVNLAARWGPDGFYGGGTVAGEGAQRARRVRLRFPGGITLDDDTRGGAVVFGVEQEVRFPAQVDVLDASGTLMSTYPELGYLA